MAVALWLVWVSVLHILVGGVTGGYMGPPRFRMSNCTSHITRHHVLNDIVSRAFASAKIPVTKEPSGLFRSDSKRPNGVTLIDTLAKRSVPHVGITVATTLADSYISASASSAGAAAEMAKVKGKGAYT